MKLQPGDYVSTQGMTEDQYHAIAKRFIEAGAQKSEYYHSLFINWHNWQYFGWHHGRGLSHWDNGSGYGAPNRLLTIDQILSGSPEWDGTGLPPVGSVVRMSLGFTQYDRVIITYIGKGVFCYINDRTGMEHTGDVNSAVFRPIRSDRDKAIDEIHYLIEQEHPISSYRAIAEMIYHAGYRKPEREED